MGIAHSASQHHTTGLIRSFWLVPTEFILAPLTRVKRQISNVTPLHFNAFYDINAVIGAVSSKSADPILQPGLPYAPTFRARSTTSPP